jgi:NAD(P)H-flavin reductase
MRIASPAARDEVVHWPPVSLLVTITGVQLPTPRSRLLQLDLRGQAFAFRAGQAILLGNAGAARRWPYSIASSPERLAETGGIEVLVALTETSEPPRIPLTAGAELDLEGPLGDFTLPKVIGAHRLLFVAGGTGIAPLRAMMDHALRTRDGRAISVLYSARSHQEFAFIGELQAHAEADRIQLHQTVTRDAPGNWPGHLGRINRSHFNEVLHDPATTQCFICGPPAMVQESVDTLAHLGVPTSQIHFEQWGM